MQRHLLYKQFVAWNCNGYMNNLIFQELPDEDTYFSVKNDEGVSLDLRASSGYVKKLKNSKINLQITSKASAKYKLRVRIWAFSLSEYLYVPSKSTELMQSIKVMRNFWDEQGKTV